MTNGQTMHALPGSGFPATRWTLVLAAGDPKRKEARSALVSLCENYWYPLYAYLRRRGYPADQAQDLTQESFEHSHEERLRQILRLVGRISAAAQIGIQRIPVILTERNQSGSSFFPFRAARGEHERPACRRKPRSRQRVHGLAVGHRFRLTRIPLNRIRKRAEQGYNGKLLRDVRLGVFRSRLPKNRDIGVSVLPQFKEVLECLFRVCGIARQGQGARDPQPGDRIELCPIRVSPGSTPTDAFVVRDFSELRHCIRAFMQPKISQSAQVNRFEISALVRCGRCEQFDAFRRLIAAEGNGGTNGR